MRDAKPPPEEGRYDVRPEGASVSVPPANSGGGPFQPRAPGTVELVVRLQPNGPTVSVKATPEMTIAAVMAEALARLKRIGAAVEGLKDPILSLEGWRRLDERKTVAQEGLKELAFIQLGRPAEVGLSEDEGT